MKKPPHPLALMTVLLAFVYVVFRAVEPDAPTLAPPLLLLFVCSKSRLLNSLACLLEALTRRLYRFLTRFPKLKKP